MMSTMAMAAASSLNPDAPMFIPAAFRRVEDYSPQWWELVQTTAWFRQHQLHDDVAGAEQHVDDVAALLPDDSVDLLDADDLFYAPPPQQPDFLHVHHKPAQPAAAVFGRDMDAVVRNLNLTSPRSGGASLARTPRDQQPMHGGGKPSQYVGGIHQPR